VRFFGFCHQKILVFLALFLSFRTRLPARSAGGPDRSLGEGGMRNPVLLPRRYMFHSGCQIAVRHDSFVLDYL